MVLSSATETTDVPTAHLAAERGKFGVLSAYSRRTLPRVREMQRPHRLALLARTRHTRIFSSGAIVLVSPHSPLRIVLTALSSRRPCLKVL